MKYFYIYKDVMQDYINKADTLPPLSLRKQQSWAVIASALRFPNTSLTAIYKTLERDYGILMNERQVVSALQDVRLNAKNLREEMLKLVKETVENIKEMLEGNVQACKLVGEFVKTKVSGKNENGKFTYNAKSVLTYMAVIDNDFKNSGYIAVIKNYSEIFCGRILKEIYKRSARKLGIKFEESNTDEAEKVIKQTRAVIEASENENDYNETGDKDKQIVRLQFEVDNLKNTLEIVEAMFEDLKESVDRVSEEAKATAISSFFLKFNSSEYGNILDSLPVVEENLKAVKQQRIQLPPLVISLPIIFKQLIKFIGDSGIKPIDTLGREFKASYNDISFMNYEGSPYLRDDEIKDVVVTRQGWKYDDIIISNPTVTEKI